jgi:hypothetical protein
MNQVTWQTEVSAKLILLVGGFTPLVTFLTEIEVCPMQCVCRFRCPLSSSLHPRSKNRSRRDCPEKTDADAAQVDFPFVESASNAFATERATTVQH